jgi:cell wall-associated NlpC family hydrolase
VHAGLYFNENIFCTMKKQYILLVIGCIIVALTFTCCTGSSPRFVNRDKKSPPETKVPQGPRFSSKEVEEETKENDKKPDPKEVESITKGARDFRKEKNPALKPLDQSKMMREISKYMGVSYVHGGASLDGMDCSGYTMTVYKNSVGKLLPRSSAEQAKVGKPVELNDLKFGDLIFFNTRVQDALWSEVRR